MDKQVITDQIEILQSPAGYIKLTVSGIHAVNLLTYLQQEGVQASGQDAPLFGQDNFPTIYYIHFNLDFELLKSKVLSYLESNSIKYEERFSDNETERDLTLLIK